MKYARFRAQRLQPAIRPAGQNK